MNNLKPSKHEIAPNIPKPEYISFSRDSMDELYNKFNKRDYVHPDPLEFLYRYEDISDREITGLIASSLAYGRVAQILSSIEKVLRIMGVSPSAFLLNNSISEIQEACADFKHRFTDGVELSVLMTGMKQSIAEWGSLKECFFSYYRSEHDTLLPALDGFACGLSGAGKTGCRLTPSPNKGSACKRLNLFLRWMVRRDAVDPGGWDELPASKLVVPLDTHLHSICTSIGITKRKQADLKTSLEITEAFRSISPEDPVKYDFSLTRLGILKLKTPCEINNSASYCC